MTPPKIQESIREVREQKGWNTRRMAQHVCLSERQIKQLEGEPGDSFYSDHIRLAAAKRVLARMGYNNEQLNQLFSVAVD